jgi:hypothetical protein
VIVWHELYTADVEAATRFYTELLGAELETADMGEHSYPMLRKDGRTHAGFFRKEHEEIPSHWYPYALVDDVDATVEQAKSIGSAVHAGPLTVVDSLRVAVLGDPQHATFGVMSWDSEPESPATLFVWDELHATDVEAARGFYGDLLGWTTQPFVEGYEAFTAGETTVGGLMQERGGSPVAYWLTYFGVDDTDAVAARAMELGAGVVVPPESMENVGRYAVLTDPTGAAFGIHQRES